MMLPDPAIGSRGGGFTPPITGVKGGCGMRHFGRWGPAIPVLMALASLAAPTTARAGFVLTLEEAGFSNLVINDGDASDQHPTTGKISYLGSYGDFTVKTAVVGYSNRTTPGTGL